MNVPATGADDSSAGSAGGGPDSPRLRRLVKAQAAIRRVATLVALGVAQEEIFKTVTEEVGRLFPVDSAGMYRYESDETVTLVGSWGAIVDRLPLGSSWKIGGHNLGTRVFETGNPARIDSYVDASGEIGTALRGAGVRWSVGVPVTVEGRLWGMMGVASTLEEPPHPDTELHLASFTELVAMAIANAEGRAELVASRARIVAAADESRRQIQRDLHDGTQQQLISVVLDLRRIQSELPSHLGNLSNELSRLAERVMIVFDEVREISRGIHPAILSHRGLSVALKQLTRGAALPVELDLRTQRRLPDQIEVAAYYAVSEAMANAVKHARASVVRVELDAPDAVAQLEIHDDGIGGADPAKGSGLTGVRDRVEALGGTFDVISPASGGTTLLIEIPIEGSS